jgi:hypothetical protein
MIISDLNTLEVVDGSAVVGGFFGEYPVSINASFRVSSSVSGHVAQSRSTANALGYGTATETDNNTYTTSYSSHSDGSSVSISSY